MEILYAIIGISFLANIFLISRITSDKKLFLKFRKVLASNLETEIGINHALIVDLQKSIGRYVVEGNDNEATICRMDLNNLLAETQYMENTLKNLKK